MLYLKVFLSKPFSLLNNKLHHQAEEEVARTLTCGREKIQVMEVRLQKKM